MEYTQVEDMDMSAKLQISRRIAAMLERYVKRGELNSRLALVNCKDEQFLVKLYDFLTEEEGVY